MPWPDVDTVPAVVPGPRVPGPIEPGSDASSRRARRQAARRGTRRRRLRRLGMVLTFLVVTLGSWVALGHTDTVGEVPPPPDDRPTTTVDTRIEAGRDHVLDEPGGLITGPNGIVPSPATRVVSNNVVLVGDSVLQAAAPLVPERLERWSVIADTRVGRFLPEATSVLKRRSADLGEIVVLNLGNNYNGDHIEFAAQVEDALAELRGVDHVIWINAGEFEEEQREVNAVLRAAVRRHRNLILLDWNTVWEAHRDDYTGADDLHLTPEGSEAYADLVADAVERVARLANLQPAPDPKDPVITTRGSVPQRPRSSNGSGSGTTRRRTTTTIGSQTPPTVADLPDDGGDDGTGGGQPGDGSGGSSNDGGRDPGAPVETSPPATEPPPTNPPPTTPG